MIWPFRSPPPLPPLTVLIHMPKAGGTTLTHILRSIYGRRLLLGGLRMPNAWRQEWPEDFKARIRVKPGYWRAFSGHTAYGIHELFDRRAIYLSSVRNPVERFESYYNYVRCETIHHHYERAKAMSIGEFYRLMRDRPDPEIYNFQCQLICGRKDFAMAREFAATKFLAIAPLSAFEPSIDWIRRQLDWPAVAIPRLNQSGHKDQVEDLTDADRRELIQ